MNAQKTLRRTVALITVPVLAVAVLGGVWLIKGSAPVNAQAAVDDAPGAIAFGYVDVDGGMTSLLPSQPGRVVAVDVKEGDTVEAGQSLLRLDDRQAKLRLEEATAAVRAGEQELAQARQLPGRHAAQRAQQLAAIEAVQHRLAATQQQYERQKELADKKLVNPRELAATAETIKELEATQRAEQGKLQELDLLDPKPTVERAEAQLTSLQGRLAQAQLGLDECTLKAPRAGTVLRLQATVGDMAGVPGAAPPVLFCAEAPLIIRAEVAQEYAGRISAGAACSIEDDANSTGASWAGKVLEISGWFSKRRSVLLEPTQFNDVRTLECIISVEAQQKGLRIGQRVRVKIGKS
jgi:multidrug resistance efflux pump